MKTLKWKFKQIITLFKKKKKNHFNNTLLLKEKRNSYNHTVRKSYLLFHTKKKYVTKNQKQTQKKLISLNLWLNYLLLAPEYCTSMAEIILYAHPKGFLQRIPLNLVQLF